MIRYEEYAGGSGNADWCSGLGWLALIFLLLASSVGNLKAQTPNPVTPGYQICSNASGVTRCSFQAAGTDNVLGTFGLPVSAVTVATCGAQTLTAAVPNVLTLDQTGTLCTSLGSGGITAAVTVANGADVAEGATTDAAATAGSTGTVSSKLRLMTTQLGTINTTLGTPFQAGGSIANTTFAATQGTSPWVVSGTVTATLAANQSVNLTQVGGAAVALGSAVSASSIPVVIASNQGTVPVSLAPSSSASIGITPIVSAAAEATHVLKASAGNAYAAYATNLTGNAGFLILLNATSAPADGAVTPLACAALAPNGVASINYAPGPPGVFSTGITAVVTGATTCFTKTTTGGNAITAFISGSVQ